MRVLIAAGGTAGHINPALAIAGALKAADPTAEIHFAGRREGMEYGLVTKAGYPFHHIEINGFQRRLNLENIGRNLVAIWHLALSGPRTRKILNQVAVKKRHNDGDARRFAADRRNKSFQILEMVVGTHTLHLSEHFVLHAVVTGVDNDVQVFAAYAVKNHCLAVARRKTREVGGNDKRSIV